MTDEPNFFVLSPRVGQELMTLREIALYADVRPSAVSNWKRRHEDFPSPVEVTSSGTLYRAAEIIDWLERHGKVDQSAGAPEDHETWDEIAATAIAQMLRETDAESVRRIVLSVLLHAAISRGPILRWASRDPEQRRIPLVIPPDARAQHLIERFGDTDEGEAFVVALKDAWRRCEAENDELSGLLLRAAPEEVQPGLVMFLLRAFDEIAIEGQGHDLDPIHRVLWDEIAPFESRQRGEMTPAGLSRLMVSLVCDRGPQLLDLAAGRGHLVFDAVVERWRSASAATVSDYEPVEPNLVDPEMSEIYEQHVAMTAETQPELVDPDAEALAEALIWSLIYDVPVTLTLGRLGESLAVGAPVDALLVDAPGGVRPTLPSDPTNDWLEVHAAGSLEIGFLVAARKLLAPAGRAAIAISTRIATLRSSRFVEARADLVNSGHIEAVIALPGNLHHGPSRPMSVIVMTGAPNLGPVLLIDATACGRPRRRHRELSETEAKGIIALVHDWRAGQPLREPENVRAVAVDPVELEDYVLDASIYLPLPEMPDLGEIGARVERIERELGEVSGRLASSLSALLEQNR
jgi:hypothetical protein